ICSLFFFFQAEDGIRDGHVTGVQTCALPISIDFMRGTSLEFAFFAICLCLVTSSAAAQRVRVTAPAEMVWMPGGEFAMGAVVNGRGSCEMAMPSNDPEPIHRVRVDGFWMDKTVVTNEQ